MEVEKALLQISEIHAHMLKSELYRGYRARTVAATGLVAVLGGALMALLLPRADVRTFVLFWVVLAALCAAIILRDMRRRTPTEVGAARKRSAFLMQFVPSVMAGAALTAVLAMEGPVAAALLPGLWLLLFGLGVLACRPYLPPQVLWVGVFYLAGATWLLLTRGATPVDQAWALGSVFGIGQAGAALVLHLQLERDDHEQA